MPKFILSGLELRKKQAKAGEAKLVDFVIHQ
jgi:hypothetical protein